MITKSIVVSNLPNNITESELVQLFESHGMVKFVQLIKDRKTGESSGVCFVEMEEEAAENAIENLDGVDFQGHPIRVTEPSTASSCLH